MTTADQLIIELEAELAWRQDEIRLLQNLGMQNENLQHPSHYRALILLVYAHVEGYTKFALLAYVRAVNEAGLKCGDVKEAIVAAALHSVLLALRNTASKSDDFRDVEDWDLHQLYREQEFIKALNDLMAKPALIPDTVVDTESNLWPKVLKKNLYRLGLPFAEFDAIEAPLKMLVNLRNEIGHGATRKSVKYDVYIKMRDAAFLIMNHVSRSIFSATSLQFYRR